jgi:hypothetical protein
VPRGATGLKKQPKNLSGLKKQPTKKRAEKTAHSNVVFFPKRKIMMMFGVSWGGGCVCAWYDVSFL